MIEQTTDHGSGGLSGITLADGPNEPEENRPLEKLTEDKNRTTPRRPRRFSYQCGSRVLPGYTIKRGIGIGGFGEVYFGISDAGKEVALKRIQRNLEVELRGVSQCLNLKHINLIALWDIRQDSEGESWVVMEYVPGDSLRDLLEKNPQGISVEDAQQWFTQILHGVAYLHDQGIVHRDLKPGNIFYDQDEKVVKIGDYGLSKFISTSRRDGQTESVGTFHYMAPEIGKGSYGKEIDIYSLGIILCEILTGRVPFDGESGQEIIMKHLTATPEIDFVEPRFQPIILKALAKDPAERFSSVQQMMEAIDWNGDRPASASGSTDFNVSRSPTPPRRPVIEPLFIREDFKPTPQGTGASEVQPPAAPEPLFIGDDEIQWGELRQVTDPQQETEEPWSASRDGLMRMSAVRSSEHRRVPVVLDRPRRAAGNEAIVSTVVLQKSEPIAMAVGGGYQRLQRWWAGIAATPVKVILVAALALFVLLNAQWLFPLSIGLGGAYLVYYLVRAQVTRRHENPPLSKATTIRPFSRKECLRIMEQKLRATRLSLPLAEKFADGLGSLLIASVVIGTSTLVALGFSGFSLDGSVEPLAVFGWLASTTLLATACCIALTRAFESSLGNPWRRRLVSMSTGLLVGYASWLLYGLLLVDAVTLPAQLTGVADLEWMTAGKAGLMTFLIFFASYFLVIRWWKVGDALRSAQFSLVKTVLHVILAIGIAWVTSFPVIWGLILGGTLSIAVQLSSTWIKTAERERIQFEVMQSISA